MKNIRNIRNLGLFSIFFFLFISFSCHKDSVPLTLEDGQNSESPTDSTISKDSITTQDIDAIKSLYQGEDIKINEKFKKYEQVNIEGSVISAPSAKNTPLAYLILQNGEHGIALLIRNLSRNITYSTNEFLKVDIQEGTLRKVDGNYIITGLSLSDITRTGDFATIQPRSVSLKELAENFDKYNETLVSPGVVGFYPTPPTGSVFEGAKGLYDHSDTGSIKLYTFQTATFSQNPLAANKDLNIHAAIPMHGVNSQSGEKQIWLRDTNDFTTLIPFSSPVIITGFLGNPDYGDQEVAGKTKNYLDRPIKGGFEYIQFMATKDIDFSETPFSVVTMVSYPGRKGATAKGWTAGVYRTAKFDLTSGIAKKGSVFYVGSGEIVIDGYYGSVAAGEGAFSTDISGANWIYNKPFWNGAYDGTPVGDPFEDGTYGEGTKGWLDSRSSAGSDGIAVFKGTTVGKDSVPIDAIFFNEDIGGTYDAANNYGFLIPRNDLYDPINPSTGDPQPLFGEGTNTWAVPKSIANASGVWTALGGIVTPLGMIEKRSATGIQLYQDDRSSLSDLETGPGVTKFKE